MDDTEAFLNDLLEEVYEVAHADGAGHIRHRALTTTLLRRLEESGMCEDPQAAFFRHERGSIAAEVHGYVADAEDDLLTLFYVIDATSEVPLGQPAQQVTTSKAEVDRGIRRMLAFIRLAASGRHEIEESLPAAELAGMVRDAPANGVRLVLQVLTTGRLTDRAVSIGSEYDAACEVADLTRLMRVCGGIRDGSTDIDFEADHDGPLSCLIAPPADDGLRVLLTCVPGPTLAAIYNKHRAALLERNVRTFLQFTGKVNKGIRETLLTEPGRFLPYNNGLSATARSVDLVEGNGSVGSIRSVADFQIVNGGQTTASIAAAIRRDGADLSRVVVPMKLTIVPADRLDELVPKISRYANTQNRVQDSDFSANEPWHVGVERLSRDTWTKPTDDAPRGTRWFYERSRGQYRDEMTACGTTAGRRRFRQENPVAQKLTKTDIAKYLSSWDQYPHVVSRGAQKCFLDFMQRLGADARRRPKPEDFRRFVALALLFRRAERMYGEMGHQGFRANVVTYTVASLSRITSRRLDVEGIWSRQAVPEKVEAAMRIVMTGVREIIINPPAKYRNVTEWSKRPECWQVVLGTDFHVDLRGAAGPVGSEPDAVAGSGSTPDVTTAGEREMVEVTAAVSASAWFDVSHWAKETDSLKPWQRQIAFSLGKLRARGDLPSVKQARQGRVLLLEAVRLGFSAPGLATDQIEALRRVDA